MENAHDLARRTKELTWRAIENVGLSTKYLFKFIDEGKMKDADVVSLGQLVIGEKSGRQDDKEITVLMMGGMPVEDVAWSYEVYQKALAMGLGQKLTLGTNPFILKSKIDCSLLLVSSYQEEFCALGMGNS